MVGATPLLKSSKVCNPGVQRTPLLTENQMTTNDGDSGAAPKSKVKKAKKGVVVYERSSSEAIAKKELGIGVEFHGANLMQRDPAKAKRSVTAELELSQLEVIPGVNPRSTLGEIAELAASIKSEGLLSSLVVRPGKKTGKFEVIAGERRFRAMTAVNYKEPIPVVIRMDAVGDDDKALAIAVAENSEDGRLSLNMVEVGRACQTLHKQGWTVARIAKETGLHAQRVRRSLDLMETPKEVQKNISDGRWSVQAGLEYARLDPKTRDKIRDKLSTETTAQDIRAFRKEAERAETVAKAAKGEKPGKTTKTGAPALKSEVTAWRGSRDKQSEIRRLAALLVGCADEEVGTEDYHEIRGALGALLWDRGDRSDILLPSNKPSKSDKDYAAQMKDLAAFNAVAKSEAAKHSQNTEQLDNGADGDFGA